MSPLSLAPLRLSSDDIAEVVAIYASNPAYGRASGEYDPERVRAERVEAVLREDTGSGGFDVLLARDQHRKGHGRVLAELVEERLRSQGRNGVRLAVLENNPTALAFWSALGRREIDRRADAQYGRPCVVMHKPLA